MKTIFKKTKIVLLLVTLSLNFGIVFADATSSLNQTPNKLADSFSLSQAVKDFSKTIGVASDQLIAGDSTTGTDTSDSFATDTMATVTNATDTDATTSLLDESKDSCDYFDDIMVNVLNLQTASAATRKKIQNVETTINSETTLRDSILNSVKSLLGLRQKDTVVFRGMKKDISSAKIYYDNLDLQLVQTQKFLDENDCDVVAVPDAKKVDDTTQTLVDKEATFRKQLVADLKNKLKVLQDSVASAKK